ncbi:V-type proton ATPase subunit S1 [Topomyia yanbarensis]|uniref:V-type proton ATPase subunit S1 n=1 Tax=Topomyia yanbarensis TaxID=2498891 RepID=UPI00273C65FA|nr:V-type proton ATPase subunit S1 [Topomyia yanbarensis]
MKFSCTLTALLLLGTLCSCIQASDVPVFIWGKPSVTYIPALTQYETSEFSALIESQAGADTFTIVFVENSLSTEDLSKCKLGTQTCFRNLAKINRKSYLPNVQNPLEAFEVEEKNVQMVQVSEDGTLSERIIPKGGAVAIVNLQGGDFASHDATIDSLYSRLHEEFDNILAVYTAETPSFSYSSLIRRTRQAKQDDQAPTMKTLIVPNTFIIAYEKFSAGAADQTLTEVSFDKAVKSEANNSDSTLQIELNGPSGALVLNFLLTQGSWEIVGVQFDNTPYYLRHRVHVNQDFSYRCNSLAYVTGDSKKQIVFDEVQIQPHWGAEDGTFTKFGDAWNCVGFTTPGILTGLFLVAIFIFIGAFGITWMMDIRTMDRYDDPKGKTITVSAAE